MQKILNDLNFDFSRFTLREFIAWLERTHQSAVVCLPYDLPPGVFGAWLTSTHQTEYILFDPRSSPLHRTHVILHELCHWMLNHRTHELSLEEEFLLLNDPSATTPGLIETVAALRRAEKDGKQEAEAETLSSLIHDKIIRHRGLGDGLIPTNTAVSSFFNALDRTA